MGNPDSTEKYVKLLADYFEIQPEDIIIRLQKPWGIEQLARGELPDKKLARLQNEKEDCLEAALRLIFFDRENFPQFPKAYRPILF